MYPSLIVPGGKVPYITQIYLPVLWNTIEQEVFRIYLKVPLEMAIYNEREINKWKLAESSTNIYSNDILT